MAKITVDTHLFRELGQLLVGRDSTALAELIKNAYDADATGVTVHGEYLGRLGEGVITIVDNGVGMTRDQFERGFLRIASRIKEGGDRRSVRFKRRFTGAKGVGRLAAHKLARKLRVYSVADPRHNHGDGRMVDGRIDWDAVESVETLDELGSVDAVRVRYSKSGKDTDPGTRIELSGLRRCWSERERAEFFFQAQSFLPPVMLVESPVSIVCSRPLFGEARTADVRRAAQDPGFKLVLTGEFESGDEYWDTIRSSAHWVIEIDADRKTRAVTYAITPTKSTIGRLPGAKQSKYTREERLPESGPFFQARILVREGQSGKKKQKPWLARTTGVRVYMEGFRVLPYGELGDDWLRLNADYRRRSRTLRFASLAESRAVPDEGLRVLGNESYCGAVFMTQQGAPDLQMLVNREGFLPNESFFVLGQVLREAIDLSVRVRALVAVSAEETEKSQRQQGRSASDSPDPRETISHATTQAAILAAKARDAASAGNTRKAARLIDDAASLLDEGSDAQESLLTGAAVLRILAAVGLQMAAFVHEVDSLLGMTRAIEDSLSGIRDQLPGDRRGRQDLTRLLSAVGDLRRVVERQAAYLTDVTAVDARRRRSRQPISKRLDDMLDLLRSAIDKRKIVVRNNIPDDLRTLPMFPAEVSLVLLNLLSNAVKHAGQGGRILAKARSMADGSARVRIENTGKRVALKSSEKWFRPFESTTARTEPFLGQGMGMGLPIVRDMLSEYGAEVTFVKPSPGYVTAIEISLPA